MSKSDLELQLLPLVDPEWYLSTYPDVANSGMDPNEHYKNFGAKEGRLPRRLKAYTLESALWGGFSKLAEPDLVALQHGSLDRDEQSYASWALARWYASILDWPSALKYVQTISSAQSSLLNRTGLALLRSEILMRSGQISAAQRCVLLEMEAQGISNDLCLAAANTALPPDGTEEGCSESSLLYWVNRIFSSAELRSVIKHDSDCELHIDNIKCTTGEGPSCDQPLTITVIMPAYNAEQFIQTALRSVMAQTWVNLEIMVVDDCSSDNTIQKVLELAKNDSRIKLLRQRTNKGAYAARNLALKHATGMFVVNHDSDDWSHSQRLELMIAPLLADSKTMAAMASWVRCYPSLYFHTWRTENHLIEPSVSTMMFRTEAIRRLGGWDEVRVAADYELYKRFLKYYGPETIANVLMSTPLVFARHCPDSLTMSARTHVRTSLFGLRNLYASLADTWHSNTADPYSLHLKLGDEPRPFPAPLPMLNNQSSESLNFDLLLIADFSEQSASINVQRTLLYRLVQSGTRIALFHWPDYSQPRDISPEVLGHAVADSVTFILAEQTIFAPYVVVVDGKLLQHPLDKLPVLRGLHTCHIIDSDEQARLFEISSNLGTPSPTAGQSVMLSSADTLSPHYDDRPATTANSQSVDQNCEIADVKYFFDSEWYLQNYPDVSQAGIDPRHHYITNGYIEGREPGPDFNTDWYYQQCPIARSSGLSPLVHYEQIGRHAGYDPHHPTISGELKFKEKRPTILLCAHSANSEIFGAERSLIDILDACKELQLNTVVSVPSIKNLEYIDALRHRAVAVICIPTQLWCHNTPPSLIAIERFRAIIQKYGVNLVQANTIMLREPLAAARQENIPSIIHAHESPMHDTALCASIGLPPETIRSHILEASDFIIANSAFTAKHLNKLEATYIVSNVIDAKAFNIPNVVDKENITAALISSNIPKKGIQDLLQLALELSTDTPNLRLLLIGPHTPAIAALKTLESRGQLPRNISLIPYTRTPQEAISAANIVLNLSHCEETFGRTLLEGMAAGRPVLAYRQGAVPELIEDGVQGHTFEYGDIKAIANRLRQLSLNTKKIRTLGTAGRKRAKQYNIKRMSKQLGTAYHAILGHPLDD